MYNPESGEFMSVYVDFGNEEMPDDMSGSPNQDPDEFLAKKSFRIVYQTNNFFLPQIRDMIERREAINLRPEYQRRLRWTNEQKSKLIESLLLNIPVPPVFFYESDAARYEVMDGQQRLNAIRDFFVGGFSLNSLKVLTPLNGLRYTKCPPRVKRTLDRAAISAVVLLMESEAERSTNGDFDITNIRRLVFDRLNTGGRKLNAQEIRNALNQGNFNNAIIEISRYEKFTEVFGIPPYREDKRGRAEEFYENQRQKNNLYASMKDCELVLRFFALRNEENIKGSMKSMLDRAMETDITEMEASRFQSEYRDRFLFLYEIFDGAPFLIGAKNNKSDKTKRTSAALYDSAMVALDRMWDRRDDIRDDKSGVQSRLKERLDDDVSYEIIIGRRNTADAVKERIDLLKSVFLPG